MLEKLFFKIFTIIRIPRDISDFPGHSTSNRHFVRVSLLRYSWKEKKKKNEKRRFIFFFLRKYISSVLWNAYLSMEMTTVSCRNPNVFPFFTFSKNSKWEVNRMETKRYVSILSFCLGVSSLFLECNTLNMKQFFNWQRWTDNQKF